jgi:hypothetical protein
MKKVLFNSFLILSLSVMLTSCYTYSYSVGSGAQTGVEVKEKNHYLIFGLAPISTSSPTEMAGNATDYDVKIEHTFIDGLLNSITFGLYNPTTTTVTK